MLALLILSFAVLLIAGAPLVFALAVPVGLFVLLNDDVPALVVAQQMFTAADSFPLLAIPFFLLAGDLMGRAKITDRLVEFANEAVGWIRGGLAHGNVMASMLFAGISGSAIADTVAIGKVMIPAMEREGFERRDAAALTAAASIIGPIIPPSIPMVVFGSTMGVSIGALFAAGMIPGIMIGIGLMLAVYWLNRANRSIRRYRFSPTRLVLATVRAVIPLLMPTILLGGILSGAFTPTEAGAVATAYAVVVGFLVLRTLSLADLWESVMETCKGTCVIMLIVVAANPFSWILSVYQVPQTVAHAMVSISDSPIVLLLLINLLLLIAGMFMETTANILILGPILFPTAVAAGIDPLHFAIVMVVNLVIGLLTPPVGLCLFSTAAVAKLPFERLLSRVWPYLGVEIAVLALITLFPGITLVMPRWLGFV